MRASGRPKIRVPFTALGVVEDINDPRRWGRIRCRVPDLGLVTSPTDWIPPSAFVQGHRPPPKGASVLLHGFMSGTNHTMFYAGEVRGGGSSPLGRDEITDPGLYAQSAVEDFGSGRIMWNAETRRFTIQLRDGPELVFSDLMKRLAVMTGGNNVWLEGPGPPVAVKGDTVFVNTVTGVGSIVTGSAPMQADFPR